MTQALPFPDLKSVLQALGALSPAATAELTRRRQADAVLDAEISAWEQRLAPLALAAPPATPSPSVWDRIEAAIEAAEMPAGDPAWTRSRPGIAVKVLSRNGDGKPRHFMLQLAKGAALPAETIDRDKECLLLAGDLVSRTGRLGPGDVMIVRAGEQHSAMQSLEGAILYVSATGLEA